ncbi:hypothetical protein [Gimesia maris]|uniref:ABC-2 family transporter protein n=1 Tax=Gimesia maris TaxID=122 RepID=A0ABX5YIW9_9PLAN|nr:hypothetical protein [Gimesia maris]EDL59940.1 hypothetical protein PM8797T_16313 [Gimesia maris DSM 8797]QEG15662.1 ABC-2 family transporter protein [Gimesia maris]QGQ31052.1 hypothetical protein F1729_21790 [Gimesia maris]
MDLVLQSLVWKEWRERRRTFFVCLAWILCGVVYVTIYELVSGYRTPVARFGSICMVYSMFMTVFLAMRVCLSEVTQGTLPFTSSLPVSLSRVAVTRLVGGIIALVGPIFLGSMILALLLALGILEQVPQRRDGYPSGFSIGELPSLTPAAGLILLAKVTSVASVSATALFMVLVLAGARRRQESHIGFLGAAISFAWILPTEARVMLSRAGLFYLEDWIGVLFPQSMVIYYGYGDGVGSFSDLDMSNRIWLPLCLNVLILCGLGYWFTQRYGTRSLDLTGRKNRRWSWPPFFSWISFPHRGQYFSLTWINLRQSVPLALAGLALACLMSFANILTSSYTEGGTIQLTVYSLSSAMWIIGILWATVVGSGIFAAELTPGLGHFWMSRPLKMNHWFWFKYLVGLCAVLTVLDGTTILLGWNMLSRSPLDPYINNQYIHDRNLLSWSYIACFPILHAMMYSLAVLGVCWWKKPVRGAVMALAIFIISTMVIESIPGIMEFDPMYVYNNLFTAESQGQFDLSGNHFPPVFGTISAITVLTAYLASRKVKQLEF